MPRNRKVVEFNASNHAYYVNGTRFSSVTALAKKMQNSYALEKYGKRQVAIGLAQRPDLVQLVASHHGDLTPDARNKINDVCEQAYEAAKAGAAANTGTAIHTVLERIDKGEEFVPFDAAMAQVQIDYRAALDKAGLDAVPSLVERIVVFPEYNLAGTLDRGYVERGEAEPVTLLGDVKSGLNAISYPHSMAAQLGLYSLAPYMYDPVADALVEPPEWHGMVIAHTPITGGVELWSMDLDMCREVAEHALWLHRWMKRGAPEVIRQWIVPATSPNPTEENEEWTKTTSSTATAPITATGATQKNRSASPSNESATIQSGHPATTSAAVNAQPSSSTQSSTTQPADPFDGLTDGHVDPPADPARRAWVIGRLQVLKDSERLGRRDSDGTMAMVAQLWPAGLATLKNSDRHTDRDLDRIVTVLDAVEAEYTVTFGDKDPMKKETIGRWTTMRNDNSAGISTSSSTSSNPPESDLAPVTTEDSSATSGGRRDSSKAPSNTSTNPEDKAKEEPWKRTETTLSDDSTPNVPTSEPEQAPSTSPHSGISGPPTPAATTTPSTLTPSSSTPDEGPPADPYNINYLQLTYNGLTAEARSWIAGIARDAQKAGRPITLYGEHTMRRYEIVRGLVTLAAANYDDDEIVRGITDMVLNFDSGHYTQSVGWALSYFTAAEAKRFADLCAAYVGGTVTTAVDDNGRLVFTAST